MRVASARASEEKAERAGGVSSTGQVTALEGCGRERRWVNMLAEVRRLPAAWLKRSCGSAEGPEEALGLGERTWRSCERA